MNGAEMIGTERLRQISAEHYSHDHDDTHAEGILSAAADCYMYLTHAVSAPPEVEALLWPWHPSQFKPSMDPRRNLIKAGALYLAEAERYDRKRKPDQGDRCRMMAARLAATIDAMVP